MVKISAISNNLFKPQIKKLFNKYTGLIGVSSCAFAANEINPAVSENIFISDKCKNFNKTISNNYFQLKVDPKTNFPYEPDVFQKTSANHLFLGDDVIVTAPTGTGKTAIAEYIMTKNLREGKRTFYTTPLKALSNEKFKDFSNTYGKELVGLLTGDTKINTGAPIVIMTTEVYRNMATSAYFDKTRSMPSDLKTVIFDELQYLGDIDRGGVWETSIMLTPKNVQMLSLSATAKNAGDINDWVAKIRNIKPIKAKTDGSYHSNPSNKNRSVWVDVPTANRHVPLDIKLEHVLPDGSKKTPSKTKKKNSEDFKKALTMSTNLSTYKYLTNNLRKDDKLPAIYFIFSKKNSRGLLKYFEEYGDSLTTKDEQNQILEIIDSYKSEGKYLGESLNISAMLKGYATHNAGMLPTQKELVEELFQKKLLKVAIATETLSAGINMPAKTTVITAVRKPASTSDELKDGKRNLTPNEFHQMAGRAGRRGIDKHGYCIPLSCNKAQTTIIEDLISKPSNNLTSNFKFDYAFVANYMSQFDGLDEVKKFIAQTFYANNNEHRLNRLLKEFKTKQDVLEENNFILNRNLTTKGELLRNINGYEQIPLLNFIYNKSLADLNPIELSAIVGGMANIEYNPVNPHKENIFAITNESENVVNKAEELNDEVQNYYEKIKDINSDISINVNPDVINHLYDWSKLNKISDVGRDNWKELYSDSQVKSIRDEGTLFKEITMTIDLMKQMINICNVGESLSTDTSDKNYYHTLKSNLNEAINLISKEPII